jgi:uncharacterized membrane protein YphA (DoxX/SURF4 family)
MRYSESHFRRVLAGARILVGLIYVCYGYEKLFDPEFFSAGFMQRLLYWESAVAPAYSWMWQILSEHPSRWAVFFGGVEMFIGVALLLGLATRPACLIGIIYTSHRLLLTWYPESLNFTFWRFFDYHFEQIALLTLLLLMMAGHAGDVWGLGAIYHRVKVRWRPARNKAAAYSYFESEFQPESEEAAQSVGEESGTYQRPA